MKKIIKILLVILILFIPTSLALNTEHQKPIYQSPYFDIEIQEFDCPQFYLLSSDQEFTHLEIINHEHQINYSTPASTTFYTQSNIHSGNNISILYYTPIDYTLLKKGKLDLLRILVPSRYQKDTTTYTTTSITLRIHYQNKPKPLIPSNDLQKVGTIIENTEVLNNFDSQQTNFDPETPDIEYIIITNETLWSTFHNNFKSWKISNDPKINDILIVNVSDITSSDYWVNGTYGDATNATGGNSWIPDGKEVTSSWSLFNDTQAQIRNFLRDYYNNENTRYVLLGGNEDIVPPRMAASRASGDGCSSFDNDLSHACDMYYSNLHYNMNNNTNSYWMENPCCTYESDEVDWGFDLCVGRVLVNTVTELNYWINKTKNYFDGNTQGNYLQNQICAAKDGSNAITNNTWLDLGAEYSASIERQVAPITNLTFINNQNITDAQWQVMYNYVNGTVGDYDGINLILQAGHGSYNTGRLWDYYQPSYCGNALNPNFVYSESCGIGSFGEGTGSCTEVWMADDGCMVAGITNSAYGWFGASTYFVEEFLEQMFNETLGNYTYCFAQALNDAKENTGYSLYDGVWAMIYKESNFFGDPALEYNWYTESESGPTFISINGGLNLTTVYDSTPRFNWTLISNTSQYHLQVSNDSAFTDLVINLTNISYVMFPSHYISNSTTVSFTLPSYYDLPYFNKVYYCRVRAYIQGGS